VGDRSGLRSDPPSGIDPHPPLSYAEVLKGWGKAYAEFKIGCTVTVPIHFGRHRIKVPLIAMHYRIPAALVLFVCATTAAPPTAASNRYIVTPEGDAVRAAHLSSTTSGFSAASRDAHEWDAIDGFAGALEDRQAQSIEEDGTVGVKYPVIQYVMKLRSQPQ